MFKRILAAIDGSPAAERGLKLAIELAGDQHALLDIVNVVDDIAIAVRLHGAVLPAELYEQMLAAGRDEGRKLIAAAKGLAGASGVATDARVVEIRGQRVDLTILDEARKEAVDLIVLGTHGRRGVRRLLLGSDAEGVLRASTVPVLLVRSHEKEVSELQVAPAL